MPTTINGVNFTEKSVTIQKAKVDGLTGDILLDANNIPITSSVTAPRSAVKIKTNGVNFQVSNAKDSTIIVEFGSDYMEFDEDKIVDGELFFSVSGVPFEGMDDIWAWIRDEF